MNAKERTSSMTAKTFYAVQSRVVGGSWEHSRYFTTVRAARAWARWLWTRPYMAEVKIVRGGDGGEPVEVKSTGAPC